MSTSPPRTRMPVFAGGVLAAAAVVYVGLATGGSDQVPTGTTVLGYDIGGKADSEAATSLTQHFAKASAAPITVTVGKTKEKVRPKELGLALDATATVGEVTGSQWNPLSLVRRFLGAQQVDPVVAVDEDAMSAYLGDVARQVDVAPVNADVVMKDGKPKVIPGTKGRQLDQGAARELLASAYLRGTKPVSLPMVVVEPAVSDAEAKRVAREVAGPAVAGTVAVRAKDAAATVEPGQIARVLSFEPDGTTLRPVIDATALHAIVAPAFKSVERPGRDATFRIVKGKPVVVPSTVGYGLTASALGTSFVDVLTKSGGDRVVEAQLGDLLPTFTTEQAQALGVKQVVSTYVQKFPYAAYRVQNIGQAARRINGKLLKPGDVYSMNDTIGERTVENGYTKGFVVGEGGVLKMDEGGGVSTATTTIYNAAWFAGLEMIQHHAHSIWIKSRYKPGREATVAWGDFDMKFRNNTPYGIFITTKMTDESMTVTMWSTRVWDKVGSVFGPFTDVVPFDTIYNSAKDCHAQEGVNGFHIEVLRTFFKGGKQVNAEKFTTTYRPSPHVICGSDPRGSSGGSSSSSSSPSPSAT